MRCKAEALKRKLRLSVKALRDAHKVGCCFVIAKKGDVL